MIVLYALPGNEAFAAQLCAHGNWRHHALELHRFPDGESRVRIEPPPAGASVAIACTLDRPDPKLFPLLAAADTARELGATRVGLIAPYLAYMRQDIAFHPGEAVSARVAGRLLGGAFDWLVTVDPHLHRLRDLGEVFPGRTAIVHAAPRLADWIGAHVPAPLLVGPDGESAQWVREVAGKLDAPCVVAHKQRRGDSQVGIRLPSLARWPGRTPVVLDDIVATGTTMHETVACLRGQLAEAARIECVAIHGVLAEGAIEGLRERGVQRLMTTNTIAGADALIDVSADVAAAAHALAD